MIYIFLGIELREAGLIMKACKLRAFETAYYLDLVVSEMSYCVFGEDEQRVIAFHSCFDIIYFGIYGKSNVR